MNLRTPLGMSRVYTIIGMLVLAGIIVVVMLTLRGRGDENANVNTNAILQQLINGNEDILANINVPAVPEDMDRDGLSDEDEATKGTDPQKVDTDGDGLTDFDEVKIYSSNPLVSDTDGDGFSDGDEVKNNFNPAGDGALLDVNASKQQFN